jgi:hypothetical protein
MEESGMPPEVSSTLAPYQRCALDHPIRRQILRALSQDADSRTLVDLSEEMPAANISTIGYHLLVLEKCDMVSVSGVVTPPGGAKRGFASNIADNQGVVTALSAMQRLDGLDG